MNLIAPNSYQQGNAGEAAPAKKTWTVGTLTYTTGGLTTLFVWLLWGDFAWQMRDRAVLPVVQLLLKKYNASDTLVSLLFSSFPLLIGLVTGPFISYMSDRHRGPWGRRIPYLVFTTALIVPSIVALTFSTQMGAYVQRFFGPSLALDTAILTMMGLSLLVFEFGCGIAYGMFFSLTNDVVPQSLMGRFFGLFRVVSLIAGIIFNYWLFGKSEAHYTWIFLGVGALYGIGFTMMCLKVKEGSYPPPPPVLLDQRLVKRFLFAAKSYFKEGYGHRYYLWYFAATILAPLSIVPANLYNLYYARSLDMSMDTYGKYLSYSFVVSLCLAYPLGYLADRFHPLRMTIVMLCLYMIVMLWSGIYACDARRFGIALMTQNVLAGAFYTVSLSLPQKLLPRDNFAQIGSAGGTINCLVVIAFSPALGLFLDYTHHTYRAIYYIGFAVAALAILVNFVLHRKFMAFGGPKNYVAP